jgi:HD-like signal output (HDOD) protein
MSGPEELCQLSQKVSRQAFMVLSGSAFPPQPEVLLAVRRAAQADNMDLQRVADLIAKDVALSDSVINVVNSPRFALDRPMLTTRNAIDFLGINTVSSLIAGCELRKSFAEVPGISMQRFWDTATAIARHARFLARMLEEQQTSDLYSFCQRSLVALHVLVISLNSSQ